MCSIISVQLDFRPLFCHGCVIVQSFIDRICPKRSAVLYLSSPLHCNHWFVPVGHHGWPSCCLFIGWILWVKPGFLVTLLLLCVFLTDFHFMSSSHPSSSLLSLSFCLFPVSQTCKFSDFTGLPSAFQNKHKYIFSYLLSLVNCRI